MFHGALIGQAEHIQIVTQIQPAIQAFLFIGNQLTLIDSKQRLDLSFQGHPFGQLLQIFIGFMVVVNPPLVPMVAHFFDVANIIVSLTGAELHGHNNYICRETVGFVNLDYLLDIGAVHRTVQNTLHAGQQKPQLFVVCRHPRAYLSPAEHRGGTRRRRLIF